MAKKSIKGLSSRYEELPAELRQELFKKATSAELAYQEDPEQTVYRYTDIAYLMNEAYLYNRRGKYKKKPKPKT